MITLSFEEALANIKNIVKADAFNNAVYQRLSVYAKSYVVAQERNPGFAPTCHAKAMKLIIDNNLQNSDATGTVQSVIERLHK